MRIEMTGKQKTLLTLGALILIFIGPLIAAWILYTSNTSFLSDSNYGQLIAPPLAFEQLNLRDTHNHTFSRQVISGRWLLVYFVPKTCDKLCVQNLYKMRQVRLALGKDMDRMQRMVLMLSPLTDPLFNNQLAQDYSGTFQAEISRDTIMNFLPKAYAIAVTSKGGGLFLVDPLGNMILFYPPDADPEKILKDITRLLKVSQIG
jgi:cytochrome oxidase Cu insertion factor (SCO1/SenC/PrrC family)